MELKVDAINYLNETVRKVAIETRDSLLLSKTKAVDDEIFYNDRLFSQLLESHNILRIIRISEFAQRNLLNANLNKFSLALRILGMIFFEKVE